MKIEINFNNLYDIKHDYIRNTENYKRLEAQNLEDTFFNCLNDIYREITFGKLTDIYRYSTPEEIAEMMGIRWSEDKNKFVGSKEEEEEEKEGA
jgi:hypothetical protein